jgi:hypothetical protein
LKEKIVVFALLMLFGFCAQAQTDSPRFKAGVDHLIVDMFPFTMHGTTLNEVSPEYGWYLNTPAGNFKGFGFPEFRSGHEGWTVFTNHSVFYAPVTSGPLSAFSAGIEGGFCDKDGFANVGIRTAVNKLPGVGRVSGKVFNYLGVTRFAKAGGIGRDQTLFVWYSKPLNLGRGVSVRSEGFYRIKRNAPMYGQPQAWVEFAKLPHWSFGSELEVWGGHSFSPLPLFGVRYTFR